MILRLVLSFSVGMAAVIALTTRYVNEDLFGGLAAGRDISRGLLTAADHWSFTAPGLHWINQAWLSHLLLYLSYDHMGPWGPVLIKIVLFIACLAMVLFRCRSLQVGPEVSSIVLLAGILAVAPFVGLRQENFGLFFLMLFSVLVTVNGLSRRVRFIALLLVMALWCNFHGSFMLGIALIALKAVLVSVRAFLARRSGLSGPSGLDAAEWWVLAGASVIVCGLASPYGFGNITMPFRQLGTATITEHSADWLPLWRFQKIDEGLFAGGSAWPYLAYVTVLVVALVSFVFHTRRFPDRTAAVLTSTKSDWIMEAAIALVSVVLALRFGRFVLFSALSLVPSTALIVHTLVVHLRRDDMGQESTRREMRLAMVAGFALAVLMAFVCWRVAIVPYLPGNPCRPARPVARQLMSFDSFSRPLTAFMEKNHLTDRVLSGWALSPYLMWTIPEIRLFMDTRDQSYFPPHVVRDYFTIMGILPPRDGQPLELLDRYRVETVALTTGPIDFELATHLMQSKTWACLYADPYALLLVRSQSPRFRDMIERGSPITLWYPDRATRVYSEATRSSFLHGRVGSELVNALKEQCVKSPWPNYYSLICWGGDGPRRCFDHATTSFLVSEVNRLAHTSPFFSNGAEQVTDSLTRLYEILEQNTLRCGDPTRAKAFEALKESSMARYHRIRQYYLGVLF